MKIQQIIVDGKPAQHVPCAGRCKRHATNTLQVRVFGREETRRYCDFCYNIVAPQVERAAQQQEITV